MSLKIKIGKSDCSYGTFLLSSKHQEEDEELDAQTCEALF